MITVVISVIIGFVAGSGLVGLAAMKRVSVLEDENYQLKEIVQNQDDQIATLEELADENF